MVDSKTLRRNAREQAVKLFNVLALAFEFDAIPVRATPEEVAELYASLCELMFLCMEPCRNLL